MELSQLRYFKALAENGNLTKTAEQLYISAPSLSLAMKRLETELGTSLFDRVKGRMFLNDRGRIFLDAVTKGLSEIETGMNVVKSIGAVSDSHISIATTNQTLWNGLLASFMLQYPDIQISHQNHQLSQFEYEELLVQYDFILTRAGRIKNENLIYQQLFQNNELMVSVPHDHPLAQRKSVRLEELANERFIFPPRGYGLHNFYLRICHKAGFEPNIVADCGYLTLSYLHQRGLGIVFTSRRGSPFDAFPNATLLELEGIEEDEEYLSQAIYWDKRRKLGSAACLFRAFALQYFSQSPGGPEEEENAVSP